MTAPAARRPRVAAGVVPAADAAGAVLQASRPLQWPKNVLVFAAPAAAGVIGRPAVLGRALGAFWLLVAASVAVYLVNDVVDRERDRLHPRKRHRPVASGRLAPPAAVAIAAALGAISLVGSVAMAGRGLLLVVAAYFVINLAYSLRLKAIPVVELACVASGFTLRAVAGGAAAHVPISPWFVVMASFGALLVVAGKRSAERGELADGGAGHRAVLAAYPPDFLRGLRALAMSVTVTTYCLWVFARAGALTPADHREDLIWFQLSIVPFVLAVLVFELAVRGGRGGAPEELAFSDRTLQVLGAAWVVLLLCGVYA